MANTLTARSKQAKARAMALRIIFTVLLGGGFYNDHSVFVDDLRVHEARAGRYGDPDQMDPGLFLSKQL